MRTYLFPKKIISASNSVGCENLLRKKTLQIGVAETEVSEFFDNSNLILDFGKEICGGIRILTFTANDVAVRVRFGESLSECCAELGGEMNATNNHSLRDFIVNLQNYSDMTFGGTGFRFVRLDFFGEVSLKAVVAESKILSKKPIYLYKGKDKEIKKIFNVAKRTIDLCASGDFLWDGIKRDRLVWMGDMHPEMLALTTLYGRMKNIENSLVFVKEQTPLPSWMNWYPTYSMWWIISVADYSEVVSCEEFTKEQLAYIQGLIDLMLEHVDENGETHYPFNFVDWQTYGKADELQGVRAINIIAAKKAIKLFKKFNLKTDKAEVLLNRLMKKEIEVRNSKSVLGLKYFAVGLTESDKEKLVANGVSGFSTFMSYYILKAVASFDREKAIEMLKEYYGAMLKKGATSFWENFDISWAENSCRIDEFPKENEKDIHGDCGDNCYKGFRHSLCHGWASGIIGFIKEYC